jgi:hypothetical protein
VTAVEAISVPVAPATVPQPAAVPAAGVLWRRTLARAAVVPLTVLAPLVALAPTADQRFNIYSHGAQFRDNPLRIVPDTVRSLPTYLGSGNFRPLGRMLEKAVDLVAYRLTDLLGLPANIASRLVSFAAAILLTVVATVLVDSVVARGRLFRRAPSTLAALTPFAVGAGFVAAGTGSTTVLFGGLYLTSTAVVLGTAAVVCRAVSPAGRRLGWWLGLAGVAGGVALACFNEITYLALPLATAAAMVRGRWVLGLGWRRLATGRGAKLLGAGWLGFLPIFVIVRIAILNYCHQHVCYYGSDVTLGVPALKTLPIRLISWLPPLTWEAAVSDGGRFWPFSAITAGALLLLGLLAWRTHREMPRLSAVDGRGALGVAAVAGVLVLLGAGMAALNADVQVAVGRGEWGAGWRDSGLTGTAGAMIMLAVLHAALMPTQLMPAHRRRWGVILLLALMVAGGALSAAANKEYRDSKVGRPPDLLANRVAEEMANFDRTPAGDVRRCALLRDFAVLYPTNIVWQKRLAGSLNGAAEQIAQVRFCTKDKS